MLIVKRLNFKKLILEINIYNNKLIKYFKNKFRKR